MSSQGSPTLDLDVRSRRIERRIACAAVVAAIVSPWLLHAGPLPLACTSILTGMVVTSGFWRAGWIGARHRLARITWLADGRWILLTQAGESVEASLSGATRRGSTFAWLRWEAPHRRSMLLVQDDLRPGELRRLLVRLSIDRLRGPVPVRFEGEDAEPRSLGFPRRKTASLHSGSCPSEAAEAVCLSAPVARPPRR